MQAPRFWNKPQKSWQALLLAPLGLIYAGMTARRVAKAPVYHAPVPVICVGNINAGGTGKTPVCLALAHYLIAKGCKVHFISRGFGARVSEVLEVDPVLHRARDVGDEPLLLCQVAPTWICPDRVKSAKAAVDAGADMIIMDDGFQNPALFKDLNLVVVDGAVGFGNGLAIPAGPLRETVAAGLQRAHALIMIGDNQNTISPPNLSILKAKICPRPNPALLGKKLLAFAGIGRPEKFYNSLRNLGLNVIETKDFADHHAYERSDIDALKQRAQEIDALLVTTEKDFVRILESDQDGIETLTITLKWDEEEALEFLLNPLLG